MAIDDAVWEKKKEISIAEKAGEIAKILGRKYYFIDSYLSGIHFPFGDERGFNFQYYYSERGYVFRDRMLEIKAYCNSKENDFVEIALRECSQLKFLGIKIPTCKASQVYLEIGGNLIVFKRQSEWLEHLCATYDALPARGRCV